VDNERRKRFWRSIKRIGHGTHKLGPKMVLDLLVVHSNRDEFVSYLLTQYPVTVALGDFLYRLPIFKLPKKGKAGKEE